MKSINLKKRAWWPTLDKGLKGLLEESVLLFEKVGGWEIKFHDYSFIVFPAAKAYEGFLKKMFLERGFITEKDYFGKRFRIGKALNPSLEKRIREKEGVYDKIINYCRGEELAKNLWHTWKTCRNRLFHWFPEEQHAISYQEAGERLVMIFQAMDEAYEQCNLNFS